MNRTALAVLASAAVAAGCAGAPPMRPAPAEPVAAGVPDASLDWRQLVSAPFGSTLQELPFTVHEVLQFGDAVRAEECFHRDAPPPRFLGRELADYVLCFRRDRLGRIEAEAELETEGADAAFARYCDGWLKNATLAARSGANCRGRDGGIAFDARLDEDRSRTTTTLSLILSRDQDEIP